MAHTGSSMDQIDASTSSKFGPDKLLAETVVLTRLDKAVGWARKYSLFPYPFATACCAMEYMSLSMSPYDIDRFGALLPRFSPRQADLLMVIGTVNHKLSPVLKRVYEQMCEPRWVMAFGACAASGGFYDNYATVQGIDRIIPVRRLRPWLSAAAGGRTGRIDGAAGANRQAKSPVINDFRIPTWSLRSALAEPTKFLDMSDTEKTDPSVPSDLFHHGVITKLFPSRQYRICAHRKRPGSAFFIRVRATLRRGKDRSGSARRGIRRLRFRLDSQRPESHQNQNLPRSLPRRDCVLIRAIASLSLRVSAAGEGSNSERQ